MKQNEIEKKLTKNFLNDPKLFLTIFPITSDKVQTAISGTINYFYLSPSPNSEAPKTVLLKHVNNETIEEDNIIITAYWLTQGSKPVTVEVSGNSDPDFIFTNDLSGCSICVDLKKDNRTYSIYHVNDDSTDNYDDIPIHWEREYFESQYRSSGDRLTYILNNREYMTEFSNNKILINQRIEKNRCTPIILKENGRWKMISQQTEYTGKEFVEKEKANAKYRLSIRKVAVSSINGSFSRDVLNALGKYKWFKKAIGKLD